MTLILPQIGFEQWTGAQSFALDYLSSYVYMAGGTKRLLSSYPKSSPLVKLRRSTDSATQDFADGGDGWTIAGVDMLVAAGFLTPNEAATILATT